ncbi:MAG: hypothetical protein JWM14_3447 [Chitinophagaceae bacterium]|nr:hypothetical protein [Chitinophagaceae bacterium]
MKRLIINSAVFVVLAYILSTMLSWGYTALFKNYKPDQSKKNWTLVRKGDTLDYITIGSSRVFHMVDVPLLNTLTNKKGLNIGTSGSSYADNYALLVKYLERNKVQALILNADELCFHSTTGYTYPFKDYEYMPYFFEDTINQVYKDNVPKWKYYVWSGIPLSRYIEFNEHYELGSVLWLNAKKPVCKFDTTAGTELLYDMNYKKFLRTDTLPVQKDTLHIEQRDELYFHKIISLCREKGMKVILITTPLFTKGIYAPANRAKFQQYLDRLIREEKLTYINFMDVTSLQDVRYFRDMTHTNIEGTRIYTRYLARQLKDHF